MPSLLPGSGLQMSHLHPCSQSHPPVVAPPCDLNLSKAGGIEGGCLQMALQTRKEDVGFWRRERWEQPSTPEDPLSKPGLCSTLGPIDPSTAYWDPTPGEPLRDQNYITLFPSQPSPNTALMPSEPWRSAWPRHCALWPPGPIHSQFLAETQPQS